MAKILVADDDPTILSLIRLVLENQNHTLHMAQNGQEALELYFKHKPELVLLDVMMPHLNGIEVCSRIRQQEPLIPILFLTASNDMSDLVSGFDSGADDYIRKPFKSLELQARILAALRRSEQINQEDEGNTEIMTIGSLELNLSHREAYYAEELLSLSQTEFQLLHLFAQHKDQILERDFLLKEIWSYHKHTRSRTLDNFIVRLRRKLQANKKNNKQEYPCIESVYGKGYRLSSQAQKK